MQTMSYKTKSGKEQIKPSIQFLEELDEDGYGFCLACGDTETPAEPDAVRYECSACGEHKVYGAAELVLRGIYF